MLPTETHFHRLANSLAQLVWVVDADGRVSYGNSAWHAFTAIGAGTRFVDHYLPALHPTDHFSWKSAWEQAVSSGEPYALERRIRFTPDSDYVCQLEWGNPIKENGIRTGEWLITATDVDENERVILQLRHRLESKDRFLAMLAHEMRSPLAPIANALRLVDEHRSEPLVITRSCAILARQVAQLVRFVDDLFDLARLQNAQLLLRRTHVALDTVIAAAVESAQPEIAARAQHLVVLAAPKGLILEVDPGRLSQVFANLLVNASKYTNDGGQICVLVEVDLDWAMVKVRDSGIGIPREMLTRVFDAYVQAERGSPGAGLGLALVRHLVELHGGTVSASSAGPGQGSEFVVRLPLFSGSPGRPQLCPKCDRLAS
jgi:signal transduction histidine kinase